MGPDLSHDAIVELLAAFALDAVDPSEADTIRSHLAECLRCSDEVAQFRQTASLLARTGEDAPAGIWDGIATRIAVPVNASSSPQPTVFAHDYRRAGHRVVLRVALAVTAAAAAAAIAVLGVKVDRLDHRVHQVVAASTAQTLPAAARAALLDPTADRITLTGAAPDARPVAEVVALRSGTAYLINQDLTALPPTQTYQLWAMIAGRPISVGLLGPHPAVEAFRIDPTAATNTFAVTVEPAGGTVAPTRPPVASTTS